MLPQAPTPALTPVPVPTPAPTPSSAHTCSNGLEGIDANGVVCCPLACGQCGGTGCNTSGAAAGLDGSSCCGGGVKASDEYCDETNEAPCIIGSRPTPGETCSNGLEGIDGNGVVCCPLGCGLCGGTGCTTSGAAAGLGAESCCGGEGPLTNRDVPSIGEGTKYRSLCRFIGTHCELLLLLWIA
ncbi:unnamed protein product [Ectocarpus sp. 8 AP-2014]